MTPIPYLIATSEPAQAPVAVIGAGVMGAGIAQIAAQAGHPVRLLDAREGAAQAAIEGIGQALATQVAKGRLDASTREAVLGRLAIATCTAELSDCALVVEAIVEQPAPKQALLREVDAVLLPGAILASNTSSISITLLANGLGQPSRFAGLHFFNPVPLMKLVEVVAGAESDPAAVEALMQLAQRWGKVAVRAASTPGFIVNRIARPFYAETLALLEEQAGTPAQIDRALRGAGFRMGPCELMDLIGMDTNCLVTRSMFEAFFGDRRYQPSRIQHDLVDGGRLGRKSGRGFYVGIPTPPPPVAPPAGLLGAIVLKGEGPLMERLAAWFAQRGLHAARDAESEWRGIELDHLQLHLCDGRSAAQLAHESRQTALAVIDWPMAPERADALALSLSPQASDAQREAACDLMRALGWEPLVLRDVSGLPVARTLAMLVNEACDAVWQGVCTTDAADAAMKLGVNYPAGPFEWLAQLGPARLVTLLDHLFAATCNPRYRVSPLLRRQLWRADLAVDAAFTPAQP